MGESTWLWSKTAASNNTADSSIAWSEGQTAGSVNNSARSMMAAIAKMRDDTGGQLTLAGGTTAYTLTTNQVLATLADGVRVVAVVNATNSAAATLAVDGLSAKAVRKVTSAGEVVTVVNDMVAGQHAVFQYDASADTGTGAWILLNPMRPGSGLNGTTDNGIVRFGGTAGILAGSTATVSSIGEFSAVKSIETGSGAIADDAAVSYTVGTTASGFVFICTRGTPGSGNPNGLYHYQASAITAINVHTSTGITLTTGILAGTTGADGDFTLSAHTDGNIYLENRTGGSKTVSVFVANTA
jgi:hypothetical protein